MSEGSLFGRWPVHLRGRVVLLVGDGPLDPLLFGELNRGGAEIRRLPVATSDDLAQAHLAAWLGAAGQTLDALTTLADEHRVLVLDASGFAPDGAAGGRRGRVVLVGGGPGHPGLLTLRGWQALNDADVVVVDRLAPVEVLAGLDPRVEVVDVGKEPLRHPVPQDQIEQILLDRARAGQTVVRLKGGDPYLLGRGGEEVLACRAAGVDVEVIPGISSSIAGPAAAGIPVTHRGLSRSVTVVSGHEPPDYAALAALHGTIVVLMGMGRLNELSAGLISAGMPASTPAAVVHMAWTPQERTVRATVGTIARRCAAEGVGHPAVIVIGDVAAGLDELAARESS